MLDRLFIPDDTYYTLTIARSIAHGHGPTADGHTLTSGFQPLLGFLMVPVYWLTNNPDLGVRFDLALLLAADVGVVVLLFFLGRRLGGLVGGGVAGFVWAVSPNAIRVALGGLETSLAIFVALAVVVAWLRVWDRPSTWRWVLVGVLAGFGILARIDVLALVAALALVQLVWGRRRALLVIAASTAATLAPWWGYCLAELGTPIPTSGTAAHALQTGHPFGRAVAAVAGSTVAAGPFTTWSKLEPWLGLRAMVWPYWLSIGIFALLACGLAVAAWRRNVDRHAMPACLWVGAMCVWITVLLVFYGWFNVSWFTHRYLTPVTVVETLLLGWAVAAVISAVRTSIAGNRRWRYQLASVLAAGCLVGGAFAASVTAGAMRRLFSWQQRTEGFETWDSATGYRPTALFVNRVVPDGEAVGAMQSGTLSYFAKPSLVVVNLDGVVNPAAARARHRGDLGDYMRARHITWCSDNYVFVYLMAELLASANSPAHLADVQTFRAPNQPPFLVGQVQPGPGPRPAPPPS